MSSVFACDVSLLPVGEERADIVLFIIRARNVALILNISVYTGVIN